MPEFELYKDAILTIDLPKNGLRAGDIGTIVERHEVQDAARVGYSVEFFDMTGHTVAVVTVSAKNLRLPTSADRPSVREMSNTTE